MNLPATGISMQIDENTEWDEPEPLNPSFQTKAIAFPVDALPEIIGSAVQEYQAFGQQPIALVASSALGAVSLSCQCHADIERAKNLRGPTSLNLLVQAESGERKTAADKALSKGAREWLRTKKIESVDLIKIATANLKAWEATEAGLLNQIKRCNDPNDKDILKRELEDHYKKKPDPVNEPELFIDDCNQASLVRDLANNLLHGAALWAAEGGLVIRGDGGRDDNAISFFSVLNTLWDGGVPVSQRRMSGDRTTDGKRLTVNIMAQRQVIKMLITGKNGLARGIGLLARFLLAAPASTIGTRLFRESGEMLAVERFNNRVRELLEKQVILDENKRLNPVVLRFTPEAFEIWREFHDDVERDMAPYGCFEIVKDVAAKTAENAARLAGCFHVFSHGHSFPLQVSADTISKGCSVAMYYLNESKRVLGFIDTPQEVLDAERVLAWWKTKNSDKLILPKNEFQKYGPVRKLERLNFALMTLENANITRTQLVKGTKGINIEMNPKAMEG